MLIGQVFVIDDPIQFLFSDNRLFFIKSLDDDRLTRFQLQPQLTIFHITLVDFSIHRIKQGHRLKVNRQTDVLVDIMGRQVRKKVMISFLV